MSAVYEIHSVCECQALLGADLDANHLVLRGWASRSGAAEKAPANSVSPASERFDVVWHCPMCGRNTLRSFHAGSLTNKPAEEVTEEEPPAESA
jgi:hypothetical protein